MTLQALAAEAASHWGGTITRLILDRENAVFEMQVPQGRAALRLHRPGYQADAAIESELWWCAALSVAGVRVPAALPAEDGFLVTLSSGRRASAIAWVEGEALGTVGKALDLPAGQILDLHCKLGGLLATLHRATDRLTLPPSFTRPNWDIPGLVGETPCWGRFWDHPLASPDQRTLLAQARLFLHERLTRYLAEGGNYGLIHADVLRENVLVSGDALSLIDFDDSGYGFRLYDLGTALLHCLIEPAYLEIRDAMMAGYGTQDTEMVDVFTLARCCASVGWIIPKLSRDSPIHQSHLATACKMAKRVLG